MLGLVGPAEKGRATFVRWEERISWKDRLPALEAPAAWLPVCRVQAVITTIEVFRFFNIVVPARPPSLYISLRLSTAVAGTKALTTQHATLGIGLPQLLEVINVSPVTLFSGPVSFRSWLKLLL